MNTFITRQVRQAQLAVLVTPVGLAAAFFIARAGQLGREVIGHEPAGLHELTASLWVVPAWMTLAAPVGYALMLLRMHRALRSEQGQQPRARRIKAAANHLALLAEAVVSVALVHLALVLLDGSLHYSLAGSLALLQQVWIGIAIVSLLTLGYAAFRRVCPQGEARLRHIGTKLMTAGI
ncbi:hypothetical protein JNJ66_06640 [Candidatus Saccharibacteria bacterium]|nr:hypothetical protein [Candidatus Saccharibacteria bacterium]